MVVIAGKGHEQGQEFEDGRKEPFDDAQVAREAIARGGARMIRWDARRGRRGGRRDARAPAPPTAGRRARSIDTRAIEPGDLFVGLRGRARGRRPVRRGRARRPAPGACSSTPEHAAGSAGGAVLVAADPLLALQRLATAWRRALDARRDRRHRLGRQDLDEAADRGADRSAPARRRQPGQLQHRDRAAAGACWPRPPGTEVLVLEMGMRGFGQIDELARIAEPDVGVITNIGPVHLELVGSLEGVARAKAELLAHVPVAVVPADEPLLEPYLRDELDVVRFGDAT